MKLRTGRLRRKDFREALRFTVIGMQVDQYSDCRFLQNLYGRYFLYMEMQRATRLIAAYEDGKLTGLIMADIEGEKKRYGSFGRKLYILTSQFLMGLMMGNGTNSYGDANEEMLNAYRKRSAPDGEIGFLAVDPDLQNHGTGTRLVKALQKQLPDKELYLYTDDNCTYQFYDHRGFTLEETRKITMDLQGKQVPLTCMLYSWKGNKKKKDGTERSIYTAGSEYGDGQQNGKKEIPAADPKISSGCGRLGEP